MATNYNDDGRDRYDSTTTTTETKTKAGAAGAGIGIGAVILVVVLAVAGWFYFNGKNDTPRSVGNDISRGLETAGDKAKDVAKEVPQAASDAVTKGDQDTTRPNKDGSKDKLDQK